MKKPLLIAAAILSVLVILVVLQLANPGKPVRLPSMGGHMGTDDPGMVAQASAGMMGDVATMTLGSIGPEEFLRSWNFDNLPPEERAKFYKETPREDGTLLREYWIDAKDINLEIAPGVIFPAWSYNGQVPGPTIRATEGDHIIIHFTNHGSKPHSMHFHGFHDSANDGSAPDQMVPRGGSFTYEFDALPFGTHLYHCHSVPLSQHIHKGLYGAFIIDPRNDTRPKPDKELIMVMNAFDTTFDGENEIYAVNTIPFYFNERPIQVKQGELVRIHLSNVVEFDPLNSFHLHATFFDEYPTGTQLTPLERTDIITLAQAERSIIDVRFPYPGSYMFHAHITEFTEKGWMGHFEVSP